MPLPTVDVAHILIALALLLSAAHGMGAVFARLRQPRVIGEIVGGLLLGPTVLGAIAPAAQAWLFPSTGATPVVLGAVYQLGLLLLLFVSGVEIRTSFDPREGKTIGWVASLGVLVPFAAALLLLQFMDVQGLMGPAHDRTAFLLVFAVAVAVTSIPVISRIMHDLGILDTRFARVVLGVAVLEDVVLYVVLAIALGLVQAQGADFGLPAALGFSAGSAAGLIYHVATTLLLLGVFLSVGPRVYRGLSRSRFNILRRSSPVAYQLVFMLGATIACLMLGIEAFFGAFVAGIVVGTTAQRSGPAIESIKGFSFAFFIPVYFAIVGLQLDLLHGFSPVFFLGFTAFACTAKAVSVFAGSRLAGNGARGSLNLAIALNARGGPGIVLASVAFAAGIVNQPFYAVLVLLAIVTSLLAGAWLERVPREQLTGSAASAPPAEPEAR